MTDKPLKYRWEMECPRCGALHVVVTDKTDPPTSVNCGDCLMEAVIMSPMKVMRVTVLSLLILFAHSDSAARAQGGVIYGPDGRVSVRSSRSSDGSVTYYDASGRVVARSATDSTGRVTVYGADGKPSAQIEPPHVGGKR